MKKILLSSELSPVVRNSRDILNRTDFQVFVASSAEDIIATHRAENVDLIVLQLTRENSSAEDVCSAIRKDKELRKVSILIVCSNSKTEIEKTEQYKANAYLTTPIIHEKFVQKISQLLAIPERQEYRVLLKVKVKGETNNLPFFCSSDNISASGMLIETEKKLKKGDIIACSFFLPKAEQIITDAEVMRVAASAGKSFQYGIRYVGLASRYRVAIEAFIKRRAGK